jgi:hypothetical protein
MEKQDLHTRKKDLHTRIASMCIQSTERPMVLGRYESNRPNVHDPFHWMFERGSADLALIFSGVQIYPDGQAADITTLRLF